ncbi:MAG: DUF1566 domain-containing protein [Campylobacterota bacterium]|nr:DUF1566 domain-containing protein [Campylobacterota bacterium]
MIKTALILSLSTAMLSGGFMSNFSFAYGGDSDKIDKNFVRDDKRDLVLDIKNQKLYYDAKPSKEMSYDSALNYCREMDYLGYRDWEVPTKDELRSLLELSRTHISIKHAFKNVQQGIYWSSTKDRYESAWYIDFDLGRYSTAKYDHKYYVLCVRKSDIE